MPTLISRAHKPIALLAVAATLWLALAAGARANTTATMPKVPSGFVGVNIDGPLLNGQLRLSGPMTTMVGAGVQTVRAAFDWAAAQPTAHGPYNFSASDQIVAAAAAHGLTVFPVVLYTPGWDALPSPPGTLASPRNDRPYGAYMAALVKRYGPSGSFWRANPSLPKRAIRRWQIWNEPNFTYFWPKRPFAPTYVALVKAAHTAIKRVDPHAQVVLAGMPNHAWKSLQEIYDVPGAARAFDVVAVHPYTLKPSNVILFLQKMRSVMSRNDNAGKPLLVSEMGWNSSIGHHPSDTDCCQSTLARQATKIAAVLPLLASNRTRLKLAGFDYYTWATHGVNGGPSFNWAGLFQIQGSRLIAKPAFAKFKTGALAMEHCKRVGKLAGSCARR